MTWVEARVRFLVPDVWIDSELLGRTCTLDRDGKHVTIRLPESPIDFPPSENETETPHVLAYFPVGNPTSGALPQCVALSLFRVDVRYEGALTEDEHNAATGAPRGNADAVWKEGLEVAGAVAHELLSWLKSSSRQEWLGLVAERPIRYGRGVLLEAETERVVLAFGSLQTTLWRPPTLAVELGDFELAVKHVEDEYEVPLVDALMADARYVSRGAHVTDLERATLLLAVACEIQVKDVFRQKMPPSMVHVLGKRSELSSLIKDTASEAFATTFYAHNPYAYELLKEMSTRRNHVLHRGRAVNGVRPGEYMPAVEILFEWLKVLPNRSGN